MGDRRDYRRPPPREDRYRSPPRRDWRDDRRDERRDESKVPVGRHKLTLENIPDDMGWLELKDLGREYGPSLTFARTYRKGRVNCGMLEFRERGDAEHVIRELDNRRVQGCTEKLRITRGDAEEGNKGGGKGGGRGPPDRGGYGRDSYGRDGGYGRDRDRRYDDRGRGDWDDRRDDRGKGGGKGGGRRDDRRWSRSPRRREGDDEEIMTLFVKGLPQDATEDEVRQDLERCAPVVRAMIMRRESDASAFVRFEKVEDAEWTMQELQDGAVKVCGERVQVEMAKRNTSQ
eukprot:TRINITY_DN223_c0_g1_i1.p1 TRINITY_DN223_c0_g1~~TRINITY_DN223_c0_g1_i1.p1  ORF type:complete len:288 (+),score=68.06 TRINITY_DN223_c0_g1_i1:69-932(+)